MPRAIDPLVLSPDQRSELQRWVVALGTPQQVALRCRIVLAVDAGKTELAIAGRCPEFCVNVLRPNRAGARFFETE